MGQPVTHQGIMKPNAFGGVTTTTLCGRMSGATADPINSGEDVTCKLCRKILDTPNDGRTRWVGWRRPSS